MGSDPSHKEETVGDPSRLDKMPVTYQAIYDYHSQFEKVHPFDLRKETFLRIEKITKRPLICYIARTHPLPWGVPVSIEDRDLTGFCDLLEHIKGDNIDIYIVSNGGAADATERIVGLLRDRFKSIRFIVPANAYSAATLMCFSGDEILMDPRATLGPIDPQIGGIPVRAIQRAFNDVERRMKKEGLHILAVYLPLLRKYDLSILELCKNAQRSVKELAKEWLSQYMFRCSPKAKKVSEAVRFFPDYGTRRSHGRGIDRKKAREVKLNVIDTEAIRGLRDLVRSLYNQYEFWFDMTPFYKMFENAYGINWGRQTSILVSGKDKPLSSSRSKKS